MNPEFETPQYVIERARELRLNMTETEKMLWEKLRKKQVDGYRFRNQHPVYRYILDFYCHEKKLAVEIDGEAHEDSKEYDKYRDDFLQSAGIWTFRISAEEVKHRLNDVIEKIRQKLAEGSSH